MTQNPLVSIGKTNAELEEVDALRAAIGWGPGAWYLAPLIAAGGIALGIRGDDGRLRAMGGSALFGSAGFICNMVVEPASKRQGLGRQVFTGLLDWLGDRGVATVQLEATEEGRPLYEQYGFTSRWESIVAVMGDPVERGDETGITPLEPSDWEQISVLDARAQGSDRGKFLQAQADSLADVEVFVAREGRALAAFGYRRPGRIGPLVAANETAAERMARALAGRSEPGTIAPVGHPRHARFWERLGFQMEPYDVRMVAGPPPVDDQSMVYAMLNGAVG